MNTSTDVLNDLSYANLQKHTIDAFGLLTDAFSKKRIKILQKVKTDLTAETGGCIHTYSALFSLLISLFEVRDISSIKNELLYKAQLETAEGLLAQITLIFLQRKDPYRIKDASIQPRECLAVIADYELVISRAQSQGNHNLEMLTRGSLANYVSKYGLAYQTFENTLFHLICQMEEHRLANDIIPRIDENYSEMFFSKYLTILLRFCRIHRAHKTIKTIPSNSLLSQTIEELSFLIEQKEILAENRNLAKNSSCLLKNAPRKI